MVAINDVPSTARLGALEPTNLHVEATTLAAAPEDTVGCNEANCTAAAITAAANATTNPFAIVPNSNSEPTVVTTEAVNPFLGSPAALSVRLRFLNTKGSMANADRCHRVFQ